MQVGKSNVLLYMIFYDENCIFICLVGLSLGIFVFCMNRSLDGIPGRSLHCQVENHV